MISAHRTLIQYLQGTVTFPQATLNPIRLSLTFTNDTIVGDEEHVVYKKRDTYYFHWLPVERWFSGW